MERISTGNPDLDRVLGGGLPRHSIAMITGMPGTGKTILAQQLCFAAGTPERPALYLTTLSEPLPKVLAFLQELSFADVERIGRDVVYESLAELLAESPSQLAQHLRELIQRVRPSVVVVDSFKAIRDLMPDVTSWRRTVFDLAAVLGAWDATSLWLGEYEPGASGTTIEFAVADAVVELHRDQVGSRDDRFLRVAKLRGSAFLDGIHAFGITVDGLEVTPRIVTPPHPAGSEGGGERLHSGVPGLDELVETGWLRGTSTLVSGPSGAGKTLLGLHFLQAGVERGEPGLIACFQESPTQLGRAMRSLGWNPDDLVGPGRLDVLYSSPVELHPDVLGHEIMRRVERDGVRRVVIDALGDVAHAARDPRRFGEIVYTLVQWLAARGVTSMLVLETHRGEALAGATGRDVSCMSDNVVLLAMDLGEELRRTLRVIKSRGSAHDARRRVLAIGEHGMRVE